MKKQLYENEHDLEKALKKIWNYKIPETKFKKFVWDYATKMGYDNLKPKAWQIDEFGNDRKFKRR